MGYAPSPPDEYDGSICATAMRAVATITVAVFECFFSIRVLQLFGFKVFFVYIVHLSQSFSSVGFRYANFPQNRD